MGNTNLIATGTVVSLALNGHETQEIRFALEGPIGDDHAGFTRRLSGHDGDYIRTSHLLKGSEVYNWRSWTGLSAEEIAEVEHTLGRTIPVGCLLENLTVSGIPNFSHLAPATRLVFPSHNTEGKVQQAVLAVWESNGPCGTVGRRLEAHYGIPGLKTDFIRSAQGKRGVMGLVLSAGLVRVSDQVCVYPPVG